MAEGLVARALAGHRQPTVGDPACGGGALLLAAGRALVEAGLSERGALEHLWGADIDADAVATTRAALTRWAGVEPPSGHLTRADALIDPLGWPPLDVVVGNPPFLSQLAAATARPATVTAALRSRFGDAVRAYTDPAALFLLLGCNLVRPGGSVAMLQPCSVLAARDAGGVRDAIDRRARLREVWLPSERFDASVDVCAPVLDVGTAGPAMPWNSALARAHGVPEVELPRGTTVGTEATVLAPFRSEYYGLVPHVQEQRDLRRGRPLVTTGLVDLGRVAWGERPARIARRRWDAPVVDVGALDRTAATWVARTSVPKVVVATQTRVVEVAVDEDGSWVTSTPLVVVLAPPERLWLLAAAIASPAVTAWVATRAAGSALTPIALKLSAPLVRTVPLPAAGAQAAWQCGADALRSGDVDEFASAMQDAYRSPAAVLEWWRGRLKPTWSSKGGHR